MGEGHPRGGKGPVITLATMKENRGVTKIWSEISFLVLRFFEHFCGEYLSASLSRLLFFLVHLHIFFCESPDLHVVCLAKNIRGISFLWVQRGRRNDGMPMAKRGPLSGAVQACPATQGCVKMENETHTQTEDQNDLKNKSAKSNKWKQAGEFI